MIPYGRQSIIQSDIDSVVEVLKSDFLTQGPVVPDFEKLISTYTGSKYSVAFNSATSALHIACLALGLGPGDILWTVPNSFVASSNCALYCGAKVDFVDIDSQTRNISIDELEIKLEKASQANSLPKILIPVHFSGQPPDQENIKRLSIKYNFKIIEDASHAIGASRNGELVGSCKWSDVTIFSFHPVKIITTGEGGSAMCNDIKLYEEMKLLRSHGISRDVDKSSHGPWYYEQQKLGFNYRMTDLSAALGISQLSRLSAFLKKRNTIAKRYDDALTNLPITLPFMADGNISSWHLYVVNLVKSRTEITHKIFFKKMLDSDIGVNLHYFPIHLQPYYRKLGFKSGDFPVTENYSATAMSLPIYPDLTIKDQDFVVEIIRSIFGK